MVTWPAQDLLLAPGTGRGLGSWILCPLSRSTFWKQSPARSPLSPLGGAEGPAPRLGTAPAALAGRAIADAGPGVSGCCAVVRARGAHSPPSCHHPDPNSAL